jgi:peroxiredoxin
MAPTGPTPSRLQAAIALLAAAAVAGCLGVGTADEAPPFEVQTLDQGTWNLSDHRGEAVVLDFMATTCKPCNDQSRHLEETRQGRPDAAFLSLGVSSFDNETAMRDWKDRHNASWPHAPDARHVATAYRVHTMPTIVVVGPDGDVAWRSSGREVVDADALQAEIPEVG